MTVLIYLHPVLEKQCSSSQMLCFTALLNSFGEYNPGSDYIVSTA